MSTSVMYHDRFQTYLQAIDDFCLMDDGFAIAVFKDVQSLELVLSVIFNQLVSLLSATVQYHLKNLYGRDAVTDIFAVTTDHKYINLEIQRGNNDAHPKRARYHNRLLMQIYPFQCNSGSIYHLCLSFLLVKEIFLKRRSRFIILGAELMKQVLYFMTIQRLSMLILASSIKLH